MQVLKSHSEQGNLLELVHLIDYIKENDLIDEIVQRFVPESKTPIDIDSSTCSDKIIEKFSGLAIGEKRRSVDDILIDEKTLLMIAAINGHIKVCKYLVEKENADVDIQQQRSKWTALMYATSQNQEEVVKFLVQCNCDISLKNSDGDNCTHIAAGHGSLSIMKILLENNPLLVDVKGNWGQTQVFRAAICNKYEVCEFLIRKYQADAKAKNIYQTSALYHACRKNNYELSKLLIEHGAMNEKNQWGKTPLDKALKGKNSRLKDLMQSHFSN